MRAVLALLACLSMGCATLGEKLKITGADGSVTEYSSRLWILGGGHTEFISGSDGSTAYSTHDTGLSDNGRDALGVIAKGAASGLLPIP